jgi:hypothetical protein
MMMDFLKMIVTFWILPETGSKLFPLLVASFEFHAYQFYRLAAHFHRCLWMDSASFSLPFFLVVINTTVFRCDGGILPSCLEFREPLTAYLLHFDLLSMLARSQCITTVLDCFISADCENNAYCLCAPSVLNTPVQFCFLFCIHVC